ncbi:MAG: SDR family NAD(P)-dependent oxidoreductase, partial [Caenispirillum bisanense]|nr:SDR family NAD(P)-dependent oxidoreductase [Caenispirillum bisanense]MCA1973450.1 SDR family NAD(P)-dependent oxidoreductase [Caenispirillum sp.]
MQPQLSDKVVIVTGASSGIGRAAATLFAAEGARLVLAG